MASRFLDNYVQNADLVRLSSPPTAPAASLSVTEAESTAVSTIVLSSARPTLRFRQVPTDSRSFCQWTQTLSRLLHGAFSRPTTVTAPRRTTPFAGVTPLTEANNGVAKLAWLVVETKHPTMTTLIVPDRTTSIAAPTSRTDPRRGSSSPPESSSGRRDFRGCAQVSWLAARGLLWARVGRDGLKEDRSRSCLCGTSEFPWLAIDGSM